MKQIGNWVFGSFFRTIGRLLVFVVLGFLIAHFVDFGSLLDNFSITDLFFEKVKADGWTNWHNGSGSVLPSIGDFQYMSDAGTGNFYGWFDYYMNSDKSAIAIGNESEFEFNMFISMNFTGTDSISYTDTDSYNCTFNYTYDNPWGNIYDSNWNITGKYEDIEVLYNSLSCPTNSSQTETYTQRQEVIFYPYIKYGDNNWNRCEMTTCVNGTCNVKCKLNSTYKQSGVAGVGIAYGLNNYNSMTGTVTIKAGIAHPYSTNVTTNQLLEENTNAINSQTQQQQQQHQQMMDDNTTQAEDDAESFFDGFSVPDTGGLSAIITAPLNTIRSLLNSSCTNLVLPLPYVNENLTLPCMNSIYTQHFGAFYTLYQTIILAIIAYRCIRSIFFDLHGFTNPDDDRIEVMDL